MLDDTQRQDQKRTHTMDKESGAGFQKDHGETIDLVQAYEEERRRNVMTTMLNTREKDERTTENKMERLVTTSLEKYWTVNRRRDSQGDMQ